MASVEDSRFKQRSVIEFLVHENESVVNIHKRLCAVYGSCAVDRSTVGRWAKRVKASRSAETELRDLPRAGRPATANTPNMLNRADAITRVDRCITTRQLALQLSISTGSVFNYWDCCSSMTMHALTQTWEPGNTSTKWVGRCCPFHPTAHIWHGRTSTFWVS
jgi:transposase